MMCKPKISVLIPVYNSEKYIKRCIKSVLSQTFLDFELLLIDDGSSDSSGDICDTFAEQDERIKVYHKQNEGISATREFCITHAQGDYIQFIDSDDWVEPDMLHEMYNKAKECDSDIVGCNFIQEFGDYEIPTTAIYNSKEDFLRSVIGDYWGVLWKLMIRRELFTRYNIHFPNGIDGGEDYFVVVSLLLKSKKVSFVDFYPYHYIRNNNNSFISSPSFEKIMFQIKATEMVEDILIEGGMISRYFKELTKRKVATKIPLMRLDFFRGIKVYGKLPFSSFRYVIGKKNKLYFIFAYFVLFFLKFK